MHYVYLRQSIRHPERRYIGSTNDLKRRLAEHNAGKGEHTGKYRPWRLVTHAAFADTGRAQEFERYLKTGSGQAFVNRRLW